MCSSGGQGLTPPCQATAQASASTKGQWLRVASGSAPKKRDRPGARERLAEGGAELLVPVERRQLPARRRGRHRAAERARAVVVERLAEQVLGVRQHVADDDEGRAELRGEPAEAGELVDVRAHRDELDADLRCSGRSSAPRASCRRRMFSITRSSEAPERTRPKASAEAPSMLTTSWSRPASRRPAAIASSRSSALVVTSARRPRCFGGAHHVEEARMQERFAEAHEGDRARRPRCHPPRPRTSPTP